ncbi:MAG: GlxA family transcriptional regulator [Chthoniobacterales bacterium]
MTYFSELDADEKSGKAIGFLGFDGVTTLDLTGPLEAFATARTEEGNRACYETVLIGVTGKTFVSGSGATFKAEHTIRTAPTLDTVIIPGGAGLRNTETSHAIGQWLVSLKENVRIASVSTGIYPLAQSGLLDGRRVTTHWRYTHNVASTFRRLKVDDSGSFIKDDRFYTCGGGTAGIEMSLALIQEDFGAKSALGVARELVVNLRPSGEGERHVDPGLDQPGTEERLAELPAWITSRLRANLSVEVLAERACLCPRHFSRLFKRTFQSTPADFVEHLRITEAARRLASQPLSIGGVAESVGFKSVEVFRRAFERRFGVTPRNFQRQIRENTQNGERFVSDFKKLARSK